MKKWIFLAVCLFVITGCVSAQKTSAVSKQGKEDSRKGMAIKQRTDSAVAKATNAAPVKLLIAAPVIATDDAPLIKQN